MRYALLTAAVTDKLLYLVNAGEDIVLALRSQLILAKPIMEAL